MPEITEVMDGKNRKELIAHSMTAQGARDTEKQLEALQNYMRSKLDAEPEEIHMYNELLVANSGEQVKAIIIPIYRDKNGIDADATLPQEDTIATLCGAVAGLEHLAHGVDLPVALYHVKEPEPGKIGYVGQGRKELRAVALKAIGELQGPDPEKLEEHLNDACGITLTPHEEEDYYMRLRRTNMRKFLHNLKTTPGLEIDPFTPIDEQRTQTDKLTTQERTTPDKAGRQ